MEIQQISDHVYANVDYEGGNVACINTEKGIVLIDTPMLPADVTDWKAFVEGLNPNGILYIIATHHHFDHIIGNHQLGGKVIMQETAMEKMMKKKRDSPGIHDCAGHAGPYGGRCKIYTI